MTDTQLATARYLNTQLMRDPKKVPRRSRAIRLIEIVGEGMMPRRVRGWLSHRRRRRLEATIARLTRDHEQCEAVIQLFAKVTLPSPVQSGVLMLEFVSRRLALAHAIEDARSGASTRSRGRSRSRSRAGTCSL